MNIQNELNQWIYQQLLTLQSRRAVLDKYDSAQMNLSYRAFKDRVNTICRRSFPNLLDHEKKSGKEKSYDQNTTMGWIRNQVKKGLSKKEILSKYSEFVRQTGSKSEYDSFRRRIDAVLDQERSKNSEPHNWEIKRSPDDNQPNKQGTKESFHQENCPTKEAVTKLLTNYVVKVKRKLELEDLGTIAKENSISLECITSRRDLSEILSSIYNVYIPKLKEEMVIQQLKDDLKREKSEKDSLKREVIDFNKIYGLVSESISSFEELPDSIIDNRLIRSEERELIFTLSDVHLQETVRPEEVMGINKYNDKIAFERLDTCFEEIVSRSSELNIKNLVIACAGDLIGGIIHDEIIRTSDLTAVQAVIKLAEYLSKKIRYLTKYFKSIRFYGVVGNHGRILGPKPFYNGYAVWNWETLIYTWMQTRLEGVVTTFAYPESPFVIFDSMGKKFLLAHGHTFGGGGNGYQVFPNGISKNAAKLQGVVDQNKNACMDYFGIDEATVDYFIIGHFHNPGLMNSFFKGTPVFINGSVKGPDAYSIQRLSSGTKPSQKVLVVGNKGVIYSGDIEL